MPFKKGDKGYWTGKKRSPEDIEKFKKGHLGQIPWNKGITTGIKPWLGKKRSLATKKKISKTKKLSFKDGYVHPFLGKHHTLSSKKKMKISAERTYAEGRVGSMSGKYHTDKVKKKMSELQIGKFAQEKHWNWQGGITPEIRKERNSLEFKIWRKKVFKRDNYTCQKTKIKGGKLCSHHIKNFSKYNELRFIVDN